MTRENYEFKIRLGYTKPKLYGAREVVYLNGFSWDCDWYWGGGYIGNRNFHAHFDGAFLDVPDVRGHCLGNFVSPWHGKGKVIDNGCSIWENVAFFLDDVPEHLSKNWWRIKDLYKQFYIYKKAAEAFRHGGRCSSIGCDPREKNKEMEKAMNDHIEQVIIPQIMKVLEVKNDN